MASKTYDFPEFHLSIVILRYSVRTLYSSDWYIAIVCCHAFGVVAGFIGLMVTLLTVCLSDDTSTKTFFAVILGIISCKLDLLTGKPFITSFHRTFDCPIICTDTYSQCYFLRWHLQQCLIQSSSLVSQDAIFVDKS